MIDKLLLYGRTVKHLKPKQVAYQMLYRLKPKHTLKSYLAKEVSFAPLIFSFRPPSAAVTSSGGFTFLNQTKAFDKIDWDYQGYGKLWNYNLQYMAYLGQPDIDPDVRIAWLKDINTWLTDGRLALEPYPVSLRIMNTIRFLSQNDVEAADVITGLYAQATYLHSNLEYHIMGNHLLENAFALLMAGCAFNKADWKANAEEILAEQLEEQILADGAHFELSPMYHQIILFRVLELTDWYRHINTKAQGFLQFVMRQADRMLGWLHQITFSDGSIPHVNDSADGIAPSTKELVQFAATLNLSAAEIGLRDSGYRKYTGDKYECVVDAGQIGPSYQPGHSHADTFSFLVHYDGKALITEVGTSTYQSDSRRSYERSTAAHNTVEVAGANQSEVWAGFRVGHRANAKVISETAAEITAEHDGYLSKFGAIHRRHFKFKASEMAISDVVESSDDLTCKAYFHIHPNVKVDQIGDLTFRLDTNVVLSFKGCSAADIQEYDFADGYNKYKIGKIIITSFSKKMQSVLSFSR
jgi:uncharacterized heparinase superfamily protein